MLEQLKHDRDLCNFNPSTGESEPISEDCRKSAEALDMAIKVLEKDNDEIFKQFKTKAFYESEDILGTDMVDTYMITDYLAELLGVEND